MSEREATESRAEDDPEEGKYDKYFEYLLDLLSFF